MERLESDSPLVKFNNPLKYLNKPKTFTNLVKKKTLKSNGRAIILKSDRKVFSCVIVMAPNHNIIVVDGLCHPVGPLPWELGTLTNRQNCALAKNLQKNAASAEEVPEQSATTIDGMSLAQRQQEARITLVTLVTWPCQC